MNSWQSFSTASFCRQFRWLHWIMERACPGASVGTKLDCYVLLLLLLLWNDRNNFRGWRARAKNPQDFINLFIARSQDEDDDNANTTVQNAFLCAHPALISYSTDKLNCSGWREGTKKGQRTQRCMYVRVYVVSRCHSVDVLSSIKQRRWWW